MVLEVVVAGWVVTALGRGGALKTSNVLLLESGEVPETTRGLLPLQKCLLYCSCVVSIVTYGFQLWFFAGAPTKAQMSLLAAMQCKAAFWILGAFRTLPTGRIETLAVLFNCFFCSSIYYMVLSCSLWQTTYVTNFIQLVSPQLVDRFSQTKLCWKAPNESYSHMCGMYKSNNKWLRYQAINSCKSFVC